MTARGRFPARTTEAKIRAASRGPFARIGISILAATALVLGGCTRDAGERVGSGGPSREADRCSMLTATISGTSGHDSIDGTDGAGVIFGLEGNDTIRAHGGDDVVCGGPGDDTIGGGPGNDYIDGGEGRDTCIGGPGSNEIVNCE